MGLVAILVLASVSGPRVDPVPRLAGKLVYIDLPNRFVVAALGTTEGLNPGLLFEIRGTDGAPRGVLLRFERPIGQRSSMLAKLVIVRGDLAAVRLDDAALTRSPSR
jgi:hypothetical protein